MVDTQTPVKHNPYCPTSDYWRVPEAWRVAFERNALQDRTKWKELSTAGLKRLAFFLLYKFATDDDQETKKEWVSKVTNLIERAIRAQQKYKQKKSDPREAVFHARALAARERIYKISVPGSKTATLRDLIGIAQQSTGYRLWVPLLHRVREDFVKTCLDRGRLGPKYYLFLLRGLARLYGVRLSLNNLTYLADCAEAAFSSTYAARSKQSAPKTRRKVQAAPSTKGTEPTLNRETLSRFFKTMGPLERAILDDTVPLLSHLLPTRK